MYCYVHTHTELVTRTDLEVVHNARSCHVKSYYTVKITKQRHFFNYKLCHSLTTAFPKEEFY